jgi:hypothetical protein
MRGFRGLYRLLVIAISVATLVLMAAVGAAAASGTLGSNKAAVAAVRVLDNGKHKGECHPPGLSRHHHKHGTPGHKNHPCGEDEDGDDSG